MMDSTRACCKSKCSYPDIPEFTFPRPMFFRKPKYILPKSYRLASRAERKKRCNGCGPKGYDWFVPDHLLGIADLELQGRDFFQTNLELLGKYKAGEIDEEDLVKNLADRWQDASIHSLNGGGRNEFWTSVGSAFTETALVWTIDKLWRHQARKDWEVLQNMRPCYPWTQELRASALALLEDRKNEAKETVGEFKKNFGTIRGRTAPELTDEERERRRQQNLNALAAVGN